MLGFGSSSGNSYVALGLNAAGQGFIETSGNGTADGFSDSAIPDLAWSHIAGVQHSTTSRRFFLDGAPHTISTQSSNPSGMDRVGIGQLRINGNLFSTCNGDVAHAAAWNAALTDEEMVMLARVSPLLVRPQSLVFYAPVPSDATGSLVDVVGGRLLTFAVGGANAPAPSAFEPSVALPVSSAVAPMDAATVSMARTLTETVLVSDAVSRLVTLPRALGDGAGVADGVTRQVGLPRVLGETVGVADGVQRGVSGARAVGVVVGVADGVGRLLSAARAAADAVIVTDAVERGTGAARALGDGVAVGVDGVTRVVGLVRLLADPVAVADAVQRSAANMGRLLGDVVVVTDAVSWPYVPPGEAVQLEVRIEVTPALDTVVTLTPVIDARLEVMA